jgi:hypothetical protein
MDGNRRHISNFQLSEEAHNEAVDRQRALKDLLMDGFTL